MAARLGLLRAQGRDGEYDDEALRVGRHWVEVRWSAAWTRTVTDSTRRHTARHELPYVAAATPGGVDTARSLAGPELLALIDDLEPVEAPPA